MKHYKHKYKHLYANEKGELYTSVTTLIEKHKRPFPVTPHSELNLAISGMIGSATHTMFEMYNLHNIKHKNPIMLKLLEEYIALGDDYAYNPDYKYAEYQIHHEKSLVAGTVDRLIYEAPKTYRIIDYKTNLDILSGTPGTPHKKTGKPNKGSKFGIKESPLHGKNMDYQLSPTMFGMALQLSSYELIFKELGITITGREIIHIDFDELSVQKYELPYVKECELLFDK